MIRLVLIAQGLYYIATGAWPIASRTTFESITGPKTDFWLVHMVGALAVAIGATILNGARGRGVERKVKREVIFLAAVSAIAFASIDVVYVLNQTIRPIYLGDAAIEALFLLGLLIGRRNGE
ncbi:MAG TPA: hypothetical protein VFP58_01795 [Candidatus Eisenbacteria bacterium]|nr:hypothetical protein [Candidatus Eisenbacteria bacterium]